MAVSNSPTGSQVDEQRKVRPGGWGPRLIVTMVLLLVVGEVAYLAYVYPLSALSEIGTAFNTNQLAWVGTILAISAGICSGFVGNLADRFGKKRMTMVVLLAVLIGTVVAGTAQSFEILLVGRALQGPAVTLTFLTVSLVRDIFPTRTLPLALSVVGTGNGALSVVAALLVGPILIAFGWRGTFWVPAVFTVLAIVVVHVLIPEGSIARERRTIDVIGGLLLGAGVGSLLLVVSFGQTWGWVSPLALGFGALGIVLLLGWVLRSLRITDPLVNIRVLATLPATAMIGIALLGIGAQSWGFSLIPLVVLNPEGGLGLSLSELGYFTTIFSAGLVIGGLIAGPVLSRIAVGAVAVVGTATLVVGYGIGYLGHTSAPMVFISCALVGIAAGIIFAVVWNLVVLVVTPEHQASTASVLGITFSFANAAVSVIVFAVMNSQPQSTPGLYSSQAIGYGFLVPAIMGVGALVLAVTLATRRSLQAGTHS